MKPISPVTNGNQGQWLKTGRRKLRMPNQIRPPSKSSNPTNTSRNRFSAKGQESFRPDMKLACPNANTIPPPLNKRSAFLPHRPTRRE